jgi:acyl carrier protein
MVPSAFIFLDSLPLAGPGKVNLKALPDPGQARPELEMPLALPRNPVEQEVARIWADILGVDRIGVDDDFFQLGGDSLLASRVISQVIRTFRVDVPLHALFDAPTVTAMASVIARNGTEPADSERVEHMLAEVEGLSEEHAELLLSKKVK